MYIYSYMNMNIHNDGHCIIPCFSCTLPRYPKASTKSKGVPQCIL